MEVHTQLLSAFAATAHMNNTRADSIATEMFVDSAQLRGSMKRLFATYGYWLKSATPAVADILARLSAATSTDQVDLSRSHSGVRDIGRTEHRVRELDGHRPRQDRSVSAVYYTA